MKLKPPTKLKIGSTTLKNFNVKTVERNVIINTITKTTNNSINIILIKPAKNFVKVVKEKSLKDYINGI
jgi:hypothetical protein